MGTIDTCVSNLCLLCFGKTAEECLVYADRTYYDSVAKTINPCPTGCNKCTGNTPDKCSDAQPGWVKLLVNNTASLAPCPAGCAGCTASGANITCTSCPTDVLGGSVKEVNATVFTCTFNCVAGC